MSESFVEIPLVDLEFMNQDHGNMIEQINALCDLLEAEPTEQMAITQAMQQLLNHCQEHFAREESLMQQYHFPALGCHLRDHNQLLADIEQHITVWQQQSTITELNHFIQHTLMDWLARHVNTMDTIAAQFIVMRQNEAVTN